MSKQPLGVTSVRRALMKEFGLSTPAEVPRLQGPTVMIHKSLAMRQVEARFGRPLEQLLSLDKRGSKVAQRLGISTSTVARWRQSIGLTRPTIERIVQ